MPDWLQKAFEENSILWLLISSVLGGIIGASIRLVFDVILPQTLQQRREVLAIDRKYRVPILLASEELRNRLGNIIRHIKSIEKENWLQHAPPGYYYVSTLYVVAQFFGWFRILRREVTYLDFATTQETRRFENFLGVVEKSFSDPGLLRDATTGISSTAKDRWVFSFWLQAIGDAMIEEQGGDFRTIGFATFNERFLEKHSAASSSWFDALGRMFQNLKEDDPRFHRIIAIHTVLNAFVEYLDSQHLRTKPSSDFSNRLSKEEVMRIKQRIENVLEQ